MITCSVFILYSVLILSFLTHSKMAIQVRRTVSTKTRKEVRFYLPSGIIFTNCPPVNVALAARPLSYKYVSFVTLIVNLLTVCTLFHCRLEVESNLLNCAYILVPSDQL